MRGCNVTFFMQGIRKTVNSFLIPLCQKTGKDAKEEISTKRDDIHKTRDSQR